ncbi:hypothetical protein C7377_0428 [Balneicella halophila]|uniref:Inner membrane protein YgaP-like transmembrane domain-containing protein n=1 Tax=Balneicella halophila TaxID=1537566 RepID=A0A7L4UQS4_BALHA|nr:DUF2892 domain-containing protein [Balneicella halophila]PVX52128.1 hypothetical protein C7377_0428 [Balneicella halophila]
MENNKPYCHKVTKHERIVRFIAGTFVLLSVLLGYFVHIYWLALALFVALNLIQSSLTKWCLLNDILRWLKIKDN